MDAFLEVLWLCSVELKPDCRDCWFSPKGMWWMKFQSDDLNVCFSVVLVYFHGWQAAIEENELKSMTWGWSSLEIVTYEKAMNGVWACMRDMKNHAMEWMYEYGYISKDCIHSKYKSIPSNGAIRGLQLSHSKGFDNYTHRW